MNELNNQIQEILYKYGKDMTDVQHIKATQAIQDLLAEQVRLGKIEVLEETMPHTDGMRHYNTVVAKIAQLKSTTLLKGEK